jgi:hypothetical protein
MYSEGESVVSVDNTEIINDVWVASKGINRRNTYRITHVSKCQMIAESINPDLPRMTGSFDIDRNILHFRFQMDGSRQNGHEVITRRRNVCYVCGALYDGDALLQTWTATINRK